MCEHSTYMTWIKIHLLPKGKKIQHRLKSRKMRDTCVFVWNGSGCALSSHHPFLEEAHRGQILGRVIILIRRESWTDWTCNIRPRWKELAMAGMKRLSTLSGSVCISVSECVSLHTVTKISKQMTELKGILAKLYGVDIKWQLSWLMFSFSAMATSKPNIHL